MAYPYDDEEEQKDPLVIEDTPRPSHNLIDQSALQQAPQTAPTPVVQVDAYARNTSPPADQKNPAAVLAQDESAYTPAVVPEPVRLHPVSADPFVEQQNLAKEQRAAQQDQADAQSEENDRATKIRRGLKAQGVEMETDLNGEEHPKIDDQGRTIFKPKVISPFEQREDGTYVSVHRDRFGNEQDVPLQPKIDKDTGERYVVSADGVTRQSLGIDQDYILRRDVTNLGKIATQAKAEAAALGTQRKTLKDQIAEYGNQAAMISSKRTLTDEDRASIQRIRAARESAVGQLDDLTAAHDQKSQEATAYENQFLQKRKLITDKLKDQMGIGALPPQSPGQAGAPPPGGGGNGQPPGGPRTFSPPPALKPAIDAARAGQKPYNVGGDGTIQFSTEKPLDSLNQAVKDGLIDPKYAAQHQAQFAAVQQKFQDLEKSAGSYQEVKALLKGGGAGAAFMLGAIPGARAGALAGAAIPGLGETGVSEAVGGAIGGLATGAAAAYGYNKLLKKAADYSAAVKSLNDAAELHPMLNAAGEMIAFGATAPRALTNLYRLGVMGYREAGAAGAAANVGDQLIGQATGALAFEGGIRPAFDLAKNAVADQLGIPHDKFQGPTYESLGQMVALGWLTGSSHIAFKDYSQADIASLLLRGKVRAVAGLKPTDAMSVPQVVEAMKKIGVDVDSSGAQSLTQPLNPLEAALHKDLSNKVKKMEDAGDFDGATGAQFKGATQATIPQMGGKAKVISSSTIEAERTPREPGPTTEVAAQLHDALSTHREDLQRERDAVQGEIDDPSQPMEGKADKIARVKALDTEISSLPPAPVAPQTESKNEQVNAAQRTDESQPAAPRAGGTTDSRPVPNEAEANSEVQQPEEKGAETDVRQRETPATGEQPSSQPGADATGGELLTPVPDLQKSEDAIAYGRSGTADVEGLKAKRQESLQKYQEAIDTGNRDDAIVHLTKASVYREAIEEAKKVGSGNMVADAAAKNAASILGATKNRKVGEQSLHEYTSDLLDKNPSRTAAAVAIQKVTDLDFTSAKQLAVAISGKKRATVDASAHEAATSPQNDKPTPSLAQHEADNAELGHDSVGGMPVSFENPAGSIRTNADMKQVKEIAHGPPTPARNAARKALSNYEIGDAPMLKRHLAEIQGRGTAITKKGRPWATKMQGAHYGRFKGVTGADGDLLDGYFKEGTPKDYKGPVFVINQKKQDGTFDEHKPMVGFGSMSEATAAYARHYDIPAKDLIHSTVSMSWEHFKKWTKEGDLSKPATGTSADYKKPATTAVNEPEVKADYISFNRAKRLVSEGLMKKRDDLPPAVATIQALHARVQDVSEDPEEKLRGLYSMRAGWREGMTGEPLFSIFVDYDRLGQKTAHLADGHAAEIIDKAIEEEIYHVAQMEAVRREWLKTTDSTGWDFRTQLEVEYSQIVDAMTDEEKAAVREAYGQHGTGKELSGSTLGAEFVRQLLQQKRTGKVTEATMRAKPLLERLLAVLKAAWENIKARSAALRNAIERTQKVLDEIDAAAKPERAPPKEKKPVTPQVPALPGMTPLGGKPKGPTPFAEREAALDKVRDVGYSVEESNPGSDDEKFRAQPYAGGAKTPWFKSPAELLGHVQGKAAPAAPKQAPKPTSGASQELKDQAKKAFEGLFAPEPGLRPDEHGINLAAPEPNGQIALPKEKRAIFFDLADKMAAEGITTPEKVAVFLEEVGGGRLRPYSQSLWSTMAAAGAVEHAVVDWAPIYSKIDSANEPDTGARPLDAGEGAAEESGNADQEQSAGEIHGGSVSPEELAGGRQSGSRSGHARGGGRRGIGGVGEGGSGEGMAIDESRAPEQPDSPVTKGRPEPGGDGDALTRPSGPAADELAPADRNFVAPPGTQLAPNGTVAKLKANVSAIRILKALEQANRNATPEEKAKLAQYTGWGHTKEIFNEGKAKYRSSYPEWEKSYGGMFDQLRKLLTPEEFDAAAASTLNAHYTAPQVISAMWDILDRMGFNGGRVLEPAIGIGHFFAFIPPEVATKSQLVGLDMDSISARIAQKLYPQADIREGRFERAKLPNNSFDVILSNFPFHEVGPADKRYPNLNLHNYFFARSFDLAKPGGIIIAVTSNSTLDNNPDQRAYLASKADLVAAIRLPNNAFKEGAGTEVTTDILVFRKPDGTPFKGENIRNTAELSKEGDKPVVANEYFLTRPEMALGKHSLKGTMYRADSYALLPDKYRPLEPSLKEAISKIPENLFNYSHEFYNNPDFTDFGLAGPTEKEGSISFKNGAPVEVSEGAYKRPAWAETGFRNRIKDPAKRVKLATSFVAIRDAMKTQLALELKPDATEKEIEDNRAELKRLYQAHVETWGNLEKGNMKFLADDPEYYLVLGLEMPGREQDKDGNFVNVIREADILNRRVLTPQEPPERVADIKDAAVVSLQYRGKIDLDYISELTGQTAEGAEQNILQSGFAFKNPSTGLIETRDTYLSGNVREKLRQADAAAADDPAYEVNASALRDIQPPRQSIENISFRVGSSWIPMATYQKFAAQLLGASAKIDYNKTIDRWSVRMGDHGDIRGVANSTTFGTDRAYGSEILGDLLNLRSTKIYDTVEDISEAGNRVKRQVLNAAETDAAQAKAEQIRAEFDKFIRTDAESNKAVEDAYNEQKNSYVKPVFDGSHMVFPGMASVYKGKPLALRQQQKDGAYRIVQSGATMIAQGVGGGKTITLTAGAMELKRLGFANKPMVVVNKKTIGQFAATARQIYPNANILVATQDSFSAPNRQRFMSRITTGKWDAVIMSHSQFDLMPSDPSVVQGYMRSHIDQLKEAAAELANEEGKQAPKVRQVQTEIKRMQKQLEKMVDRMDARQDKMIYFEQSGIDALLVDEAHAYKKVPFTTKMDPVKGIDRSLSQRAVNLHTKVQFVHQRNNYRNVILATGTPVTNTLAEAWNMTRLVAPKLLEDWGVDTFDKFISTFARVVPSVEINPANQWVTVERLSKFVNGPELVKLIGTAWEVRMGESLQGLDLPKLKGGKPNIIALEQTPESKATADFLIRVYRRYLSLTPREKRRNSWVPIVTMQAGMAAAADPRLLLPDLPDNKDSVINHAVRQIIDAYRQTTPKRGTQIVFLDRFNPMNTEKLRSFAAGITIDFAPEDADNPDAPRPSSEDVFSGDLNLHNEIREKLIKAGIPRDEIAVASENKSDDKNLRMQEDMNTGKLRVLIGSRKLIGEGINVQNKLYASHHLDVPLNMTPAEDDQAMGRQIRDGNEYGEVVANKYGMKRTLAAGIWNLIHIKSKFIIQVLTGNGVGREFEDPASSASMAAAEAMAELTGDNRVIRRVELESEVRGLLSQQQAHFNNIGSARRRLEQEKQQIKNLTESVIPGAKRDKAYLEQNFGPDAPFVATLGNQTFGDIKDYEAALKSMLEKGVDTAAGFFKEKPSRSSVYYEAKGTVNGVVTDMTAWYHNPKDHLDTEPRLHTTFDTPEVKAIENSNAQTGQGMLQAAKKIYEDRDQRIVRLEKQLSESQASLPQLEVQIEKPFEKESELATKSAELADLTHALLEGDGGEPESGGSLTDDQPPTLAAPEPTDPNKDVLKSAYSELPDIEKKVVSAKLSGKPDAEIAKSLKLSETAVNTAYNIAIRKLQRARDAAQDIRATFRKVAAEKPNARTMGRPQLANPAAGELSRKLVDTVDEIRKRSDVPARRKDKDVIAEARARMAKDYAGERRDLLEKAARGLQLDDTETVIAKRIVAREALGAVRVGSNDKILEAAKLIDAYRMTGSSQSRAFRQRSDEYLSPEERASQYISESLLTPDEGRRNRLSQLGEQIVDLEQQLEEAKNLNLDPMKLKELLDERTKRLEEREKIIASWTRKIEGIKKKLAALGLDLESMSEDEIGDFLKDKTKATNAVRAVATAKTDNWDALYEYWINGLLSSPTTVAVKMLSDVAHATLDFGPQRWVEAAVNTTLSQFGMGSREAAQAGELAYVYKAIFPALGRAFTNFLESWRTESPRFEGEFTGSEFHRPQAIAGVKGKIVRTPTRLIMAADDAASSAIATLQVQAEAYRIAKSEGLTGEKLAARILKLTELNSGEPNDAWVAARDYSAVIRFQNDLGPFGKWLQKGKKGVPGVRYAIPFVKTMSNIFKTALRKTPLGSARLLYKVGREGMVQMNWDGSGYSYERKNFIRDFSEQLIAWALVFGLLGLTRKRDEDDGLPLMTGSTAYTPGNRGQRDLAMRTAPPTSVKIGDRWYNYSRIEPLGVMLTTTVDLINRARGVQEGGDVTQAMGELLNQALSQVKDKTFARGVSDILNAIQDGEHATEWAGNFATTWEPFSSLVKAGARNSDDSIREQKVWGRDEWTQNMIDSLKYRALPIAGDVMQPKVDLWGQEIKRDQGVSPATDWLYRMTVPVGTIKAEKPQAIDRLILNWNNAHPEEIFAPTPPPPVWTKKIDGKEQHIYMTRDEYRQFLTMSGRGALGRIEVESFDYNNPSRESIQAISKALEQSRKIARDQLWEQRVMRAR